MTFMECAEGYMAAHEPSWKNAKHCEQWHSTLRRYLYPKFGGVAVSSVTTETVSMPYNLFGIRCPKRPLGCGGELRSSSIGQRCVAPSQERTQPRWRGHLANLLPKLSKVAKVEHHAAMPFDDLPAFLSELRAATGLTSRALEFTILTAARTTEAPGAQWRD
jgi:hypothetical protein